MTADKADTGKQTISDLVAAAKSPASTPRTAVSENRRDAQQRDRGRAEHRCEARAPADRHRRRDGMALGAFLSAGDGVSAQRQALCRPAADGQAREAPRRDGRAVHRHLSVSQSEGERDRGRRAQIAAHARPAATSTCRTRGRSSVASSRTVYPTTYRSRVRASRRWPAAYNAAASWGP